MDSIPGIAAPSVVVVIPVTAEYVPALFTEREVKDSRNDDRKDRQVDGPHTSGGGKADNAIIPVTVPGEFTTTVT